MFKKTFKTISLTIVSVLAGTMAFTSTASAARYTDGMSWGNCINRYTVYTKYFGSSIMYVYGCRNDDGYLFTHVNNRTYGEKNAWIRRNSPYNQQLSSGYGYAVTSDMTARTSSGGCFVAGGYTAQNGAVSYNFCR